MQLRRKTVSYRLFKFYMRWFAEEPYEEPRDLCTLVRVAYVWNALQFAIIAGAYAFGGFMLYLVFTGYLFGLAAGLGILILLAAVGAAILGFVLGGNVLIKSGAIAAAGKAVERTVPYQYARAFKAKICPTVTVEG